VKSNLTWDGTVAATENGGTSTSISIASGALRYATTAPGSYAAAAGATALTTSADNPSGWLGHARGVSTFHYYYVLRVDWNDDLGSFSSTVTYSVSN
jgi:hypothetical protein